PSFSCDTFRDPDRRINKERFGSPSVIKPAPCGRASGSAIRKSCPYVSADTLSSRRQWETLLLAESCIELNLIFWRGLNTVRSGLAEDVSKAASPPASAGKQGRRTKVISYFSFTKVAALSGGALCHVSSEVVKKKCLEWAISDWRTTQSVFITDIFGDDHFQSAPKSTRDAKNAII
ncbi:MAG: hypothetical protein VB853_00900, partial [Pirellulales bacterium]